MKLHVLLLVGVASCGCLRAETTITRSVTINLGLGFSATTGVLLPPAPYVMAPGTRVQLVAPPLSDIRTSVTWYKDSQQLATTGLTLDISSASAGDTGRYYAIESPPSGIGFASIISDTANLLVTADALRLANVSNRGRVDGTQGSLLAGFVVESGPSSTYVLVRAVGPALGTYGITDALPAPALRVVDSSGKEMSPTPTGSIEGYDYPDAAKLAPFVGAFPLPTNGRDVGRIYFLRAGAYSAQVTSADGQPGTALIEIYQMTPDLYRAQIGRSATVPPSSTGTSTTTPVSPNPVPGPFPTPPQLTPGG